MLAPLPLILSAKGKGLHHLQMALVNEGQVLLEKPGQELWLSAVWEQSFSFSDASSTVTEENPTIPQLEWYPSWFLTLCLTWSKFTLMEMPVNTGTFSTVHKTDLIRRHFWGGARSLQVCILSPQECRISHWSPCIDSLLNPAVN